MNPTIQTCGGKTFDFLHPEQSHFTVHEIAHALSHICRFTGHVREHYSVAQHCVLVSWLVPREHAMAGLLHDAAEAFVGDVAAPLKMLLPDYKAVEARVEAAVLQRFGLPPALPPCVKQADLVALNTERRDLMPGGGADVWTSLRGVSIFPDELVPLRCRDARQLFIDRFFELGGVA